MTSMDQGFKALQLFITHHAFYLTDHYSETDTRVKFIDPILTDVLGWKEHPHIVREQRYTENAEKRAIDYVVSLSHPVLVVEAKHTLVDFEIPSTTHALLYKLDGVITTWTHAYKAIKQAREYCDEVGARYGLVTNGHQFIAFKALTERSKWTSGKALVVGSLDRLREQFSLFYECLSCETIACDKLSELSIEAPIQVFRDKPRLHLQNPGGGYRNELYDVLHKAFSDILLDVPAPTKEFLEDCYCTSEDVIRYGRKLTSVLVDPLPLFRAPVHEVKPAHRKDPFHQEIQSRLLPGPGDPLIVVMGGVGVGKTTFLNWYFETHVPQAVRDNSFVITCDFRKIECQPSEVHDLTIRLIIDELLAQSEDLTGTWPQIKEIYRDPIRRAVQGALAPWSSDSVEMERRVSEHVRTLQAHDLTHLKYLSTYLQDHCNRRIIIILDNMDQKSDEMQSKLYHTAQELVFRTGVVGILCMRESTYLRLTRSPEFNAFSPVDFHVKAQPIALILDKRLSFLASKLTSDKVSFTSASGTKLDVVDFDRFLKLMTRSIVQDESDPEIRRSLESLSNANIRDQLKMLYLFLVSGQTKIDEYFWHYAVDQARRIPFHEFLHSLVLQDRRIFAESLDHRFLNVFDPLGPGESSHWTCLRILEYYRSGEGQTGELVPADFLYISQVLEQFADFGITRAEMEQHFRRLAEFGLLMPESQDPLQLFMNEAFALTRSGFYYVDTLFHQFSYYSAMALDTTVFDAATCHRCTDILKGHLSVPKIPLGARIQVAKEFIDYLLQRERNEITKGGLARHPIFGNTRFAERMKENLSTVIEHASRRGKP